MTKLEPSARRLLDRLRTVLDASAGRYEDINGASGLAEYLARPRPREDEEQLTEPILDELIRRVLGFPLAGYFPQRGRAGMKPDFTPTDLVAHPFVLDAKSSTQDLDGHEGQIRRYIDQRSLDAGALFNLRELRVYRRGEDGHDPSVSFQLTPLWQVARGESLPGVEVERFVAFHESFAHRELDLAAKVDRVRRAASWPDREAAGEVVEVDIEFLVDRLRKLSRTLVEDATAQHETLLDLLDLNPGRERALLQELHLLALDIEPGTDLDGLPASVAGFRAGDGVPQRAWRQYLLRVAQFALTRILLYRSWEDVGFVQESLYDGGFGRVYDRLGSSVQAVLREAFRYGRERYRWLYSEDNNYDWFRPRDEALVEILYALVPVPLGKLDADVLGGLYESYVDEIDRDRLGQFYTPRSVVRFMLDRAGFAGPEGVARVAGNEREPLRVFDFATGSGGFLVEAARRIIDQASDDDPRSLREALRAVARGLTGGEISPFPYYLTEVNLLLQVSRLLGRMRHAGVEPAPFVLGVVHVDSLSARPGPAESLAGLDPADRLDRAELVEDERFGIVPLDAEKRDSFRGMREDEAFDLVVGNPPYVFESNNKVLFDRLRKLPGWGSVYRGKSDYLYYFLQLAVEKVRPGGRVCVVTPAGWMNAGQADWLRELLADVLRLDELYLFGSHRLFAPERDQRRDHARAPTPTIESAILVATKAPAPPGHALRVVVLEDEAKAAATFSGDPAARVPDRDDLLEEMARRATGAGGRSKGILAHRIRQADLVADRPWPVKFGARDVPTRVVRHLQARLDEAGGTVESLGQRWSIVRGIETGADAYTARIQRRLPDEVKRRLETEGARTGDPILELPPGRETGMPWAQAPDLLARAPEPHAILYGALDADDYSSLVWIGHDEDVPEAVVAELDRWRAVLATRAEFARNRSRQWYETAWSRDKERLRTPKVIALYRTDRGRFALDETGDWQPSNKATLVTAGEGGLSVAYLCGLLNSELLDLWYGVRGKVPRDVWRNYEPKPMAQIPYRHVEDLAGGRERERARAVASALAADDADGALASALAIEVSDETGAADAGAAVEHLVRAIADNRRALLPHRGVALALTATVKDPWRTDAPALDTGALVGQLQPQHLVSVRLDPPLRLSIDTDGPLGRHATEGGALVFRRARQVTARVEGPEDRLALLAEVIGDRPRLLPDELRAISIPKDPERFDGDLGDRELEIRTLLAQGRALVEAVERLVCRLYRIAPGLEDAVVQHAVDRAASSARPGQS